MGCSNCPTARLPRSACGGLAMTMLDVKLPYPAGAELAMAAGDVRLPYPAGAELAMAAGDVRLPRVPCALTMKMTSDQNMGSIDLYSLPLWERARVRGSLIG